MGTTLGPDLTDLTLSLSSGNPVPIKVSSALQAFEESLMVNGNSPHTIRAYLGDIKEMLRHHKTAVTSSTYEALAASYLNTYRHQWETSTVGRKVASLRKFGAVLGDRNFLSDYRAPSPAKGQAHPLPEGPAGVLRMAEAATKPHHRALVVLCGMMGLRCSEARAVRPSHFDWENRRLRIRGKGDKTRWVPVSSYVIEYIGTYILQCMPDNRRLVPINDRSSRKAISRIGEKALGHDVASHDLRHTFGTYIYASSNDLRLTQELMGHASSATTEGYTGVSEAKMREAVQFFDEFR